MRYLSPNFFFTKIENCYRYVRDLLVALPLFSYTLLLRTRSHTNHILRFYRNRDLKNQNIDKWSNFLSFAKSKHGKTSNDVWPRLPLTSIKNLVTWSANKNRPMKSFVYRALRPYSYWAGNKVSKNRGFIETLRLVAAKPNAFVKPIIWKKVSVTFTYHENKWYINVWALKSLNLQFF